MATGSLTGLLILSALAAYVQTLTGFAQGLIMMGGIGLLGLMPFPEAAALVSIMVLVNAIQALARGWRDIAWREFWPSIVASTVGLAVGFVLLCLLISSAVDYLKLLLGCVIITSSILLILRPNVLQASSSKRSFLFFGAIGGLMGGLFSTAGPPLVYHFYRQPLSTAQIKQTLVAIFATNAVLRLLLVSASGQTPNAELGWSLFCIPIVVIVTYAAKRWPPPLTHLCTRRLAFFLFFLSGLSLATSVVLKLF